MFKQSGRLFEVVSRKRKKTILGLSWRSTFPKLLYHKPKSFDNFYLHHQKRLDSLRKGEYHEQSRAEQSRAEQSRAEQSRAEQSRAEQSRAEQSRAEQSRAEQSRAEQSRAEQSRAEQSRAEQSRAEQSRAEQSRAEQSRAEQKLGDYTQVEKLDLRSKDVLSDNIAKLVSFS